MSGYVILVRVPGDDSATFWNERETIEANSAEGAIRKYLDAWHATESHVDSFVAIPVRSFRPVQVKIETKTSVQILAGESVQS